MEVALASRMLAASVLSLAALDVAAQEAGEEKQERTKGLPDWGEWTFNFDAGFGGFDFQDSLYRNPHEDPSGNLSDDWLEMFVRPAISLDVPLESKGVFFGKLSAVGARNFGTPPSVVGEEASSFLTEDLYVGWRSGKSLGLGEDALEFTLGRAPFRLGRGLLVWDGAGDGGSRGGYWSGARRAWELAALGQFEAKGNTFQVFYLDRDELPEHDTGTKLWGANYELALASDTTTIGLTYFELDSSRAPLRDGMSVYNGRLSTSPLSSLPDLTFHLEYAQEDNGSLLSAETWSAQVSYKLSGVRWSPQLFYRYAFFEGDDPTTEKSEAFDSLFTGFFDWGTWWQGEIAGNFLLANSNLISHELRLHVTPHKELSGGLIFYDFRLDQPASFGDGVISDSVGVEIDAYADWNINSNFTATFVLAYMAPDDALDQATGRTNSYSYAMVYIGYSY
jgi:hypothetical protein